MFLFEFTKLYASVLSERNRLKKLIQRAELHLVYKRKRGSKQNYTIRKVENGVRKEFAISRADFYNYSVENYRYHRMYDELNEIEKFIKSEEPRYRRLAEKIEKYNHIISDISKYQSPGKMSEYKADGLRYRTLRGELVRSKSEAFICDALYKNGINYTYEPQIKSCPFLPDFYIADSVRGKSVIWEHFGPTDEADYMQKCIEKLKFYSENGFILNDNLIITFEKYEENGILRQFDSGKADITVKRFFTPQFLAA